MTSSIKKSALFAAAMVATLAVATTNGCAYDIEDQAADFVPGTATDTNSDADADSDEDISAPDSEIDDGDCDSENEALFHLSVNDSNSMASPAVARFLINSGHKATKSIRTYEFLNYYSFDHTPPQSKTVAVSAQMRPADDGASYELQIGARALDQTGDGRRPLNVTLSIDTSSSMGGTPIQRVKQSCVALAGSLRTGDIVSLVTWDAPKDVALQSHAVQGPSDSTLIGKCNALTAGGATDPHAGLAKTYELASVNFEPDRINRVILISDGGTEVGAADEELIAEHADDAEGEAIYLMGVGVGDDESPGDYNDALMSAITDAGKGSYIFIDSAKEAVEMFGSRFLANVELAARDVQVELALPPTFEMIELQGEQHATDQGPVEPQHLAPGDTMVFHQRVGSCEPSVPSPDDQVRVIASYELPLTRALEADELVTTLGELLEADSSQVRKGGAVVAYAEALKQLKTLEGQAALDLIADTRDRVTAATEALADDPDLLEIDQLLATLTQLY